MAPQAELSVENCKSDIFRLNFLPHLSSALAELTFADEDFFIRSIIAGKQSWDLH